MKKLLSTIVAALSAVSFAALVSAADVPADTGTSSAPAVTKSDEGAKPVTKPAKKHKKASKHHKKSMKKKEAAPAKSEGGATPAAPATPATPAAK